MEREWQSCDEHVVTGVLTRRLFPFCVASSLSGPELRDEEMNHRHIGVSSVGESRS